MRSNAKPENERKEETIPGNSTGGNPSSKVNILSASQEIP
jgi:hypothetical protein